MRFGRLDGALNAAGVTSAGTPLHEMATDSYDRVLEVNNAGVVRIMPLADTIAEGINTLFDLHVVAPSLLAHAAPPHLRRSRGRSSTSPALSATVQARAPAIMGRPRPLPNSCPARGR